jgi:hypothetical protein
MKKYIKEIEIAGIVLLFIGTILGRVYNMTLGAMIVIVGLILWILTFIVKALNWEQYRHDNIINIAIIIGAIVTIYITLIFFAK